MPKHLQPIYGCWHQSFPFRLSLLAVLFLSAFPGVRAQVDLQITEMYSGQAGTDLTADWFEIKNEGDVAWVSGVDADLYYDDESASPADADLIQGITDIQPGEYVIVLITDNQAEVTQFLAVWSTVTDLSSVEVGFVDGAGLGGSGDAVNIWIGDPNASDPVDTEAYPATDANDAQSWDVETGAFSSVGNASGAIQTLIGGGDNSDVLNIASPGNQGPLVVLPGTPEVSLNEDAVSPLLGLVAESGLFVGADLGDPTDPAATIGIPFIVTDIDSPANDLTIEVTSDNQAVVPDANLTVTGAAIAFTLTIEPVGVGFANITLTATDGNGQAGTIVINYAASDATNGVDGLRFHYGASDGSTAQLIDENYMWVADDEDQVLRLYDRSQSGQPLSSVNISESLGSDAEIDLEGSFRNGDAIFWLGSHTNTERSVFFRTEEIGAGVTSTLTYTGFYSSLREDLISWDRTNGHGLGADFLTLATGLEIEGLSIDPNSTDGAFLAFRGPLIDGDAFIVPVTNFQAITDASPEANTAIFGAPILMDLEGHSFRSIECSENGCLIVAGPAGTVTDFRLFTWSGNAVDAPELRAVDLTDIVDVSSIEGIASIPTNPFLAEAGDTAGVQLIIDTGTFDYYNNGSEAKDLPNKAWKKFKSARVVLGPVEIPPIANPGDVVVNEIMQNPAVVSDDAGEWFELYNKTAGSIDLNGWTMADVDNDTIVIANGEPLIIEAGGYLVLGVNADVSTNGGVAVDYAYNGNDFSLANSSDELILIAPDEVVVDSVGWDDGATFPDPNGASMSLQTPNQDNEDGSNWCEAMSAYGDGDLGTPGAANDCINVNAPDLQITEVWMGQDGTDVTADWFEITNFGSVAWVSGVNQDLYYDDESQDPAAADQIIGITDIQPGESVIVVLDSEAGASTFRDVWSGVYDISTVEVGYADGSGLGQGGDAVTLFLGGPSTNNIADYESYPAAPSGVSFDVVLQTFSAVGVGISQLGTNVAVATLVTGGSDGLEPAIGSPGNVGPLTDLSSDLVITEIFSGQVGDDLTADWFEIRNDGNAPWTAEEGILYYDDESADPADADTIFGITSIAPGASAIVLIAESTAEVDAFTAVWSPVIDLSGVAIGYTDGAGLGGGGDAVTLWLGDPNTTSPIDTASYPDTDGFDGQSWDVELMAFSTVSNTSGAVATIALGGDAMDVPNIGSPGDGLAIAANVGLVITEIFSGQAGDDLTADWFEISNEGSEAWIAGESPGLFFDDESMDPVDAVQISGIGTIEPGGSAIVLITGDQADIDAFIDVWSAVIDLTGVQFGMADGAGLGGGGDLVTLWLGDPNTTSPIDTASYPDTELFDGQSYDVDLMAFSEIGNANGAVATAALGGDLMNVPNIGSPGNGLAVAPSIGLVITEIFSGQSGDDLTADWFEITNVGNTPWISGVDADLYYDDESMDPVDAILIQGISSIEPGETAIVLIGESEVEVTIFESIWTPVISLAGVEIGYTDGAGLGGGGDLVTLWLGDPNTTTPLDTASYPDTDGFDGQSYDVELMAFSTVGNANGAVATIALGGDLMNVPNIGSPGNGQAVAPNIGLVITEIFSGQSGDDLTADWFEIRNQGNETWTSGVDADLYYDDESQDPVDAMVIQGLTSIEPGQTAIVLITDTQEDVDSFVSVWSEVIDLTGVEIGYADGAGLGGGGDLVTLWLGDPNTTAPLDTASYPDTDGFDGQSWDVELMAFSTVGNANGALATLALGGDNRDVPNIASPGDGLGVAPMSGLVITEIFSGQEGDDLTADWFEITNEGTTAWMSGVDADLYYDDESMDPVDAVLIQGITTIEPGASAIVLITDSQEEVDSFISVWSQVIQLTGVEVGYADGAGLGGGGDLVTLWQGDPNTVQPLDTASYPDTEGFDGQSYDVSLAAFSTVGNANMAVATLALGGDNRDVPNIGSPGNMGPIVGTREVGNAYDFNLFPNPIVDQVTLDLPLDEDLDEVRLMNTTGRTVQQWFLTARGPVTLDLSNVPSGVYYLQVRGPKGAGIRKVIKQ